MWAFSLQFKILFYCFVWRPVHWKSARLRIPFNFMTLISVSILFTFMVSQFLDILLSSIVANQLIYLISMLMTTIAAFSKVLTLLYRRADILQLFESLLKEPCRPCNQKEARIQEKYDSTVRLWAQGFYMMVGMAFWFRVGSSLLLDSRLKRLPYKDWLTNNCGSSWTKYGLALFFQLSGISLVGFTHAAVDTLICGLMFQISLQLEFLQSRLQENIEGRHGLRKSSIARNFIRHLNWIYEYKRRLNEIFGLIFFIQYSTSVYAICTCLFMGNIQELNMDLVNILLYGVCLIVEIFTFSYYGTRVMSKGTELSSEIFQMNWTSLDDVTKKDLMIILKSTEKPILFTSGSIITLNLDTFISILKLIYSTFNLLQNLQS